MSIPLLGVKKKIKALFKSWVDELLKRHTVCADRAATFVVVKAARVPHGRAAVVRRRRRLTNGDSRDKAACIHGWLACAFVLLRRLKAPLRATLSTRFYDRAFRFENAPEVKRNETPASGVKPASQNIGSGWWTCSNAKRSNDEIR